MPNRVPILDDSGPAVKPGARGLVNAAISPDGRQATVRIYPGGMTTRVDTTPRSIPNQAHKRGLIYGLSCKSARRLRERLLRIPFEECSVSFATLTWHDIWPNSPQEQYQCLERLHVALQSTWKAFSPSVIWRKEYQRRGAPHYHGVIVTTRPLPLRSFRYWLAVKWNAIAAPGDLKHLNAATSFDQLEHSKGGLRKALNYLSNYTAKPEQNRHIDQTTGEVMPTGRVWGMLGDVPQAEGLEIGLDYGSWKALVNRVHKWNPESPYLQSLGRRYTNAIIYGSPAESAQLLDGLEEDFSWLTISNANECIYSLPPPG